MTSRRDDPEREARLRPTWGRFLRGLWFQARQWVDWRGWVALVGFPILIVWYIARNLMVH